MALGTVPLTLAAYKLDAQHAIALDAATLAPGDTAAFNAQQIVNEAGRMLYSARPWKFRETASADLDLTISQSYVAMPSGFRQLRSVSYNSLTIGIELVDFATILDLRARNTGPTGFQYWAALVHPRRAAAGTPPTPPRLEIYPTPTATVTGALTISYRAGWTELTSDTDVPDIPLYCETLLRKFVRAVAEGYMNEHGEEGGGIKTMDDRIHDIITGPIYKAAVDEDNLEQPDYGVLGPGLVGSLSSRSFSVVHPQDTADPWSQASPYIA